MRRVVLALMILSLTGTATAQPWADRRPPYPGRYAPGPYAPGPYVADPRDHRRWQQLISRATPDPGVDVVVFRGKGGRLGLIRIAPIGGVGLVVIEYDRRPPQVVRLDRWTRRGPEAVIEVDRTARIRQIVIHSRRPHRHAYAVWGA